MGAAAAESFRQLDTFRPLELVNVVWAGAALGYRLDGNLLRGTLALAQARGQVVSSACATKHLGRV